VRILKNISRSEPDQPVEQIEEKNKQLETAGANAGHDFARLHNTPTKEKTIS